MTSRKKIDVNPLNYLTGIIVAVVFFIALFWLLKGVFNLLWWASPLLIVVALFLNYKVVLNYGKMLINLMKKNPVMGVIAVVLSFVCFPVVAAFLAGKAWLYRKIDTMKADFGQGEDTQQGRQEEYAEYEEIETIPSGATELPDLKELEREIEIEKEELTEYDDLFDEDIKS